jgi:hypothetical protein
MGWRQINSTQTGSPLLRALSWTISGGRAASGKLVAVAC